MFEVAWIDPAGPAAKSGLVGPHPSLEDLDDGDLKHQVDFRQIYASILENWLSCPATPIVGEGFRPIELFRPTMA